jgi:hypothetical protein
MPASMCEFAAIVQSLARDAPPGARRRSHVYMLKLCSLRSGEDRPSTGSRGSDAQSAGDRLVGWDGCGQPWADCAQKLEIRAGMAITSRMSKSAQFPPFVLRFDGLG